MKRHNKIIGLVLACLLLLSSLTAVVFSVSADSADNALTEDHLPEGAIPYDGNPSTSLTGSGTAEDPFIIADTADFMYFYESVAETATAGQVFKMTGDVYWNAKTSKTKYSVSNQNFAGILDGNGHTIYNAYLNKYSSTTVFGTVTGTIRNLTFDGTSLTASNGGVGGVCVTLDGGLIDRVYMKNADIGGQHIGGIAKNIAGGATISNCTVEGTLHYAGSTANGSLGGIVNSIATGESGTIQNCINRASLSGTKIATFGGIIACSATNNKAIEALTIKDCENYGAITATQANAFMGGILGNAYRIKNLLIENNTNYGALTGTGNVGGILGFARWGMANSGTDIVIRNCCNKGAIVSTGTSVGGIIGNVEDVKRDTQIKGCANYADLTAVDNVGGIIGRNNSGEWQDQKVVVVNSAVYGNVTATGNYAGIVAGFHTAAFAEGAIMATNCVLTGTVSAGEGAGGILGYIGYRQAKGATSNLKLINTFVDVTVKVPTGANAGTLIGGAQSGITGLTLDTTDSGISVKVFAGDSAVGAPAAYYTYPADGALTAQTAELPALADGAMTDGTVKNRLNTYATANSLGTWTQGATAPVLMAFYEWPAVFTNKSALSHAYTGEAVEAETQAMRADVARVDILYYLRSDLTTPLSAAPANAGEYRVTLRVYDAEGNELDVGNDFSYDFEITKAKTEIVPDFPGFTKRDDGTYSIGYTGESILPGASLRSLTSGGNVSGATISGVVTKDGVTATAIDPGVYVITFTFAGNENYEAAEASFTFEIVKRKITYPENKWTVNGTDILADGAELEYNRLEQILRLAGVDESIFEVVYQGNSATNVGSAMTATATVSLRADVAAYYTPEGEEPIYTIGWSIVKASVKIIVVRDATDAGTEVKFSDDEPYEFTGREETFYAIFVDAAGNILGAPADNTIIVSGAGLLERNFTYDGNDNYQAATLTLRIQVQPRNLGENGGTHADLNRTYDGTKTTFAPDFGTAPNGTTWAEAYETLLERKNGDTYEEVTEALRGGTYRVTFTRLTADGNYRATFTVTFTIARATATVTPPATGWTKDGDVWSVIYDRREHAFLVSCDSDATPEVTYDRDGKTGLPNVVGTYTVTVVLAETDNYEALRVTFTVRVDQKVIPTVPTGADLWNYKGPFTYDGTEMTVAALDAYLAEWGDYLSFLYDNAANTRAGTYTATLTLTLKDNINTRFEEDATATQVVRTLEWKIAKRVLSVDGVALDDLSGIYNGTAYTVEVTLPSGLRVWVNVHYEWSLDGETYTGAVIDAGVYSVVAVLTPKDDCTEFPNGASEYRTAAATVEIARNEAEIGGSDRSLTYNGEVVDPLTGLTLTGSDGTVFTVADYLTVTMTKDGKHVTEIKNAGVYRVTVSVSDDPNVTAESVTFTVTVKRATYMVDGKITVVGDTTYIAGGAGEITLRVTVTGADGVTVTVDADRLPKLPNTPGKHTVRFYLVGSDNYEPLAVYEVEVTVKQAVAKDDGHKDVSIIFDDGADPDIKFEIVENEVDDNVKDLLFNSASLGLGITHPKLVALYRYTFKDADGNDVKYSDIGEISVVITLPERYRGYDKETLFDEISVVCVSYKKGTASKLTVEKAGNVIYDAEAGTLTFKVAGPDVAYGYVREASPMATYVTLGLGGVALVAVIALALVRIVGTSRRTRPEGPDTPDVSDAGFGDYGDSDGADTSDAGDTYIGESDAYASDAYSDSTEEVPAAAEPIAEEPAEEMPVPDEVPAPDDETPPEEA